MCAATLWTCRLRLCRRRHMSHNCRHDTHAPQPPPKHVCTHLIGCCILLLFFVRVAHGACLDRAAALGCVCLRHNNSGPLPTPAELSMPLGVPVPVRRAFRRLGAAGERRSTSRIQRGLRGGLRSVIARRLLSRVCNSPLCPLSRKLRWLPCHRQRQVLVCKRQLVSDQRYGRGPHIQHKLFRRLHRILPSR